MNKSLRYPGVEQVIRLHRMIMVQMSAPEAPLRSRALLESAILRPQQISHYADADVAEQATVLAVGISQNQPFLDGNKRTAYLTMIAFLEMNGLRLDAQRLDIARRLEDVAERTEDRVSATEEFAAWIRDRLKPLAPPR